MGVSHAAVMIYIVRWKGVEATANLFERKINSSSCDMIIAISPATGLLEIQVHVLVLLSVPTIGGNSGDEQ
jgi:hypothetical protein